MINVTIVTLCATGYGKFLEECLESVQCQTYRDFEHIVVLAGCRDDTSDILRGYPDCKVLEIQDLGLCTSRNRGVEIGTGTYVVNLDSDDKMAPTFLEKVVAQAEPRAIVCPGMYHGFNAEHGLLWPHRDFTLAQLTEANRLFCCSLFPRADFLAVGGYDPRLDWIGGEDWNLWVRLMRHGCQVKIVPECLFYYRVWQGSLTRRLAHTDQERYAFVRQLNTECH